MGADMETYQERIRRRVDEILPELSRLSDDLWNNPEYNFKEYFACKSMSALLEKYGFAVETGIGGLETSVKGVYDTGKEGPNIAFSVSSMRWKAWGIPAATISCVPFPWAPVRRCAA